MKNLNQKHSDYLTEKYGVDIFESENAFLTYKVISPLVFVEILHVDKEYRNKGEGTAIWEAFKKILPQDVHTCVAEIEVNTLDPEVALVAFIKRGFKILKLKDNDKIVIHNRFRGES